MAKCGELNDSNSKIGFEHDNEEIMIKIEPFEIDGVVEINSSNFIPDDSNNISENRNDDEPISLDVLAQVAGNHRSSRNKKQNQLTLDRKKPTKDFKFSRKNPHHQEILTLEEIQGLSDKLLMNLFADFSSNEITRNYTYTCYLMPELCHETFTSFGGELRARCAMTRHLHEHIDNITQSYQDKKSNEKLEPFIAEPLPALRRRLAAEFGKPIRRGRPKTISWERERCVPSRNEQNVQKQKDNRYSSNEQHTSTNFTSLKTPPRQRNSSLIDTSVSPTALTTEASPVLEVPDAVQHEEIASTDAVALSKRLDVEQKNICGIVLPRKQPYHDHPYTVIELPSYNSDEGMPDDTHEFEKSDDLTETSSRTDGCRLRYLASLFNPAFDLPTQSNITLKLKQDAPPSINTIIVPIIRYSKSHQVSSDISLFSSDSIGPTESSSQGTWMRRQRILNRVEEISESSADEVADDDNLENQVPPSKKTWEGSHWEKRMALKCIRELRCKKKEDVMLVCKICENKQFTATATLMYHYRSHAGIKPFVCLICNTTFTRQHSLNYHMLIHNNQSRFTCKECGRKFRHPSHFKEHLRRHTGETPYHCSDCSLRFKTRNTYKRHLKTRHSKLLTLDGIRELTEEEIMEMSTRLRVADDMDFEEIEEEGQSMDLGGVTITELNNPADEDEDLSAFCKLTASDKTT